MPALYRFQGVPRTFKTREQALKFLENSPGYVKRRQKYLATYWPGLLADVKGRPAKPARTRGQLAATALAGMKTSGPGLGDVASGLIKATPGAVKANVNWMADLARSDPKTQEATLDFAIGKGLTNLAQGQPPKNWQDVAGLGIGVAGILPVGRFGVKGGKALKAALGAEKTADKAGDVGKAAKAADRAALAARRKAASSAFGEGAAQTVPVKTKRATAPKTLNETVQEAFSGVDEAIVAKNALNSQERAIRAKGAMKAYYDNGGGTAGMEAARGQLKGAFPPVDWNGFTELSPETVNAMIHSLDDNPAFQQFYDRLHVYQGLQRAVAGENVQKHQLDAIRRAFGGSVADGFTQNKGFFKQLYDAGVKVWNIPRAIMASYDLSAPFRQSLVAGTRHPVIFARNFKPMVRSAGSERVTRELAEEIPTRANFQRYGKAELKFTDMLGMREEQWPGSYVDNVIGIKHSARAYSTFLNKMRADVFDHIIDVAQAHGKNIDDPNFLRALGEHVMNSTGRGKIPGGDAGEAAATFLNNFLFSPRLLASRFQILNPVYYGRLAVGPKKDLFVLKQAAESLATTLGGVSAMVYLASNIPGAKVGTNPLSADFGKVRIGNTRLDFAGGFQPLIVLYARWSKNEYVSSSTGKKTKLGDGYGIPMAGDLFLRFMESKMAPSPRLLWDLANRENFIGEPMTPTSVALGMLPLNVQGGLDIYNTEGSLPAAIGGGLLSSIGFGVNSYPDKKKTGGFRPSPSPFGGSSGSSGFKPSPSPFGG